MAGVDAQVYWGADIEGTQLFGLGTPPGSLFRGLLKITTSMGTMAKEAFIEAEAEWIDVLAAWVLAADRLFARLSLSSPPKNPPAAAKVAARKHQHDVVQSIRNRPAAHAAKRGRPSSAPALMDAIAVQLNTALQTFTHSAGGYSCCSFYFLEKFLSCKRKFR